MTEDCFKHQAQRLRTRWKSAFDQEFLDLLAIKMAGMSNENFTELVSFFIGSRPISKPPLLQDFQDRRINFERRKFQNDVAGASRTMDFSNSTVREALIRAGFPGCKTVNEAMAVVREKSHIKKALEEK